MLDSVDQGICADLYRLRQELVQQAQPLLGDVVVWPNGEIRRFSMLSDDIFQTCRVDAGSFFVYSNGHAQFSGSLKPPVLKDFLVRTNEFQHGRFWFFSHNEAGPGRGVQCELPCRVWRLEPFKRTREEAEAHRHALKAKLTWGSNRLEYERVLEEIMNPVIN